MNKPMEQPMKPARIVVAIVLSMFSTLCLAWSHPPATGYGPYSTWPGSRMQTVPPADLLARDAPYVYRLRERRRLDFCTRCGCCTPRSPYGEEGVRNRAPGHPRATMPPGPYR